MCCLASPQAVGRTGGVGTTAMRPTSHFIGPRKKSPARRSAARATTTAEVAVARTTGLADVGRQGTGDDVAVLARHDVAPGLGRELLEGPPEETAVEPPRRVEVVDEDVGPARGASTLRQRLPATGCQDRTAPGSGRGVVTS